MVESIEWTRLTPESIVEFKEGSFWLTAYGNFPLTEPKLITWDSKNAAVAQSYLSAVVGHARKMDLRPKKILS